MSKSLNETIAAVATPLGPGGIGIIRISGPESRLIGRALFRPARQEFSDFRPYVLHHGWIIEDTEALALDEVLVSYMPGPGSYTGEDVLEINCHGGPAVVRAVLERVLAHGARAAEPGEFTCRAFINGRMDLSQAESVAELIAAPTESGLGFAGRKLSGAFSREIKRLREQLLSLKAAISADLDFPDEQLESLGPAEVCSSIREVRSTLLGLLENFSRYNCLRQGALVVLAGRVNAGKSSLLNRLLGRSRAIVTPFPGTTRDYLEEMVNLRGLPVRLVDTAGSRAAPDEVEQAGLKQGEELIQAADLVCLVVDGSEPFEQEILRRIPEMGAGRVLLLMNKADLKPVDPDVQDKIQARGFDAVYVSAKSGFGLDALISGIRKKIIGTEAEPRADALVPNLRQKNKIQSAAQLLEELEQDLELGVGFDALTLYLDEAVAALSEITGAISSEDVLERVFSSFCIGK